MKYKVGDKVRIVRHWNKNTNQNSSGLMDKWLGKTMTIRKVKTFAYKMEEDKTEYEGNGWNWNEHCIAGLAEFPKIVITTDGTETLARLYEGGKVVKTATAKCSPEDSFDALIGARIAFDRLIGEEKTEPKEQKWRVVKRPPRAGDYIRLVRETFSFNKVGDILKVCDALDGKARVKGTDHPRKTTCNNQKWTYLDFEFEVIEPVETPEKPEEPKFFTGKAVCVAANLGLAYTVGKIYEFKNGNVVNDNGTESPVKEVKSIDEWNQRQGDRVRFISLVESEGTK